MITSHLQILFISTVVATSVGQNLVPNASFEEVTQSFCGDFATVERFEAVVTEWTLPTLSRPRLSDKDTAPDCWNHISNADLIQPHTGRRMVLMFFGSEFNYRNYLQVNLLSPLKPNQEYYTEVWIRIAKGTNWVCNNVGLYFSDSLVRIKTDTASHFQNAPFFGVLPFVPQVNHTEIVSDTLDWVCLKASFTATSKAKHLLIGNFFTDENTICQPIGNSNSQRQAFYYVDDIYVGRAPNRNND